MNWKTDYRSIYYIDAPEPPDFALKREETALLVIDVQNTYESGFVKAARGAVEAPHKTKARGAPSAPRSLL